MSKSSKRVDIVSVKMVKEKSVLYGNRRIERATDTIELVKPLIGDLDREAMLLCCLNSKNEPTHLNIVSIGTVNSSLVNPKEIFKAVLLSNSTKILLFHNHPSGDPQPSEEDLLITERIKEAGEILDIELLDHIILGDEDSFISLRSLGCI